MLCQMLDEGHSWADMLYLDFEDTRSSEFTLISKKILFLLAKKGIKPYVKNN